MRRRFYPFIAALFLTGLIFLAVKALPPGSRKSAPIQNKVSTPSIGTVVLDSNLTINELESGVLIVTDLSPISSNSMVVVLNDATLFMVDTPQRPRAARQLLDYLNQRFSHPRIVAINTHYHLDCTGGNQVLAMRGIPIYGSDSTTNLILERNITDAVRLMDAATDSLTKSDLAAIRPTQPTRIFPLARGLHLLFGTDSVTVFYPGPAYTSDNVVVYFPSRKLLFGGCMVVGWRQLESSDEADFKHWQAALDSLSRFDAKYIIPGHSGAWDGYSPDLINHTRRLLMDAATAQEPAYAPR